MNTFDLADLEGMAKEEAETEGKCYELVLHYEGDENNTYESATTALQDIKAQAEQSQMTVEKMMEMVYCVTAVDHEAEQAENAFHNSY